MKSFWRRKGLRRDSNRGCTIQVGISPTEEGQKSNRKDIRGLSYELRHTLGARVWTRPSLLYEHMHIEKAIMIDRDVHTHIARFTRDSARTSAARTSPEQSHLFEALFFLGLMANFFVVDVFLPSVYGY